MYKNTGFGYWIELKDPKPESIQILPGNLNPSAEYFRKVPQCFFNNRRVIRHPANI